MSTLLARLAFAAVSICGFCAESAAAENCKLEQIASLEMTQSPQGLLVPVSIEGAEKTMILDTGSPLSIVDPRSATELHLITHRIYQGTIYTSSGQQFTQLANIHDLAIGKLHASDVRTLIYPSALTDDEHIAGLLGANFLRHYDIELDFAAHKLNLFSQSHCPGQVIYWKAGAVAVIPMHVVQSGHIVLPVTLDGQRMDAIFDTGATHTNLMAEAAQGYFHLSQGSPGLTAVGDSLYTHVFDKLELEGVAVSHPTVYIREDEAKYGLQSAVRTGTRLSEVDESNGIAPMILGMNELKRLHIFLSYKEEKLYITAGGSPSAADSQPPPAPAKAAALPN